MAGLHKTSLLIMKDLLYFLRYASQSQNSVLSGIVQEN